MPKFMFTYVSGYDCRYPSCHFPEKKFAPFTLGGHERNEYFQARNKESAIKKVTAWVKSLNKAYVRIAKNQDPHSQRIREYFLSGIYEVVISDVPEVVDKQCY